MRTCWLCGKNGADEPLDHHHIFAGGNRRKSEQLGLVVDLCHGSCHISGKRAAHRCRETAQALHEYGQRLAMKRMGWSTADFVREFGRNYLDEENTDRPSQSASLTALPEGEPSGADAGVDGFEVTDFELCVNW